jgi:hypothetical protein
MLQSIGKGSCDSEELGPGPPNFCACAYTRFANSRPEAPVGIQDSSRFSSMCGGPAGTILVTFDQFS